ncbi:MAG: hypothetical protein A2V46_13475 [Bacteroidetes bacterium RBG_19FT_COMBO_42_7]|nr:MAG: hypothetical protein A2V46_13475 [Bacteroidetes bacterium RBG_19FT_COMBO_42_7]
MSQYKKRKFLKKYFKIYNPLKVSSDKVHKDYFPEGESLMNFVIPDLHKLGLQGYSGLRKLMFTILFLVICFGAEAPESNTFLVLESPGIRPFSVLMYATAMVETMGNNLAYNGFENAVGIFQIRQVKVDEYNRLTGRKFILTDMFEYANSEKVFLYFASRVGPYNFEKIAKAWNGSGPKTEFYWKRIKEYL